jgi:preprotein translocase subunit SecB
MLVNSCLQFLGYEVNSVQFELLEAFAKINEFRISPSFDTSLDEIGDDNYKVKLSVSILSTVDNPQPFNLVVVMTGNFKISFESEDEKLKQTLLHDNTVAIMFPFLRSIIASLTTTANIPPLFLPVIDVAETLKRRQS